jgi:hypothetical protein
MFLDDLVECSHFAIPEMLTFGYMKEASVHFPNYILDPHSHSNLTYT